VTDTQDPHGATSQKTAFLTISPIHRVLENGSLKGRCLLNLISAASPYLLLVLPLIPLLMEEGPVASIRNTVPPIPIGSLMAPVSALSLPVTVPFFHFRLTLP
jgi:hypothetical protein